MMPFIPHTPESLLSRSDSKNPATTCKGITAKGRPCKRAIATSANSSPTSISVARNEVVTILSAAEDDEEQGARAFFCWQHQEQADTVPLFYDERRGMKTSIVQQLTQRNSLDTLADRLGILELNHDGGASPRKKTHEGRQHSKPTNKQEDFPRNQQQNVSAPLSLSSEKPSHHHYQAKRRGPKDDLPLTFSLFCCIQPRKKPPTHVVPRPEKERKSPISPTASLPSHVEPVPPTRTRPPSTPERPLQPHIHTSQNPYSQTTTSPITTTTTPTTPDRPILPRDPSSKTAALLSLIPKTLEPELVADLLKELAKPMSASDLEGFIYIFWLTPTTSPTPSKEISSALLKQPRPPPFSSSRPSPHHDRRSSDLIRNYTSSSPAVTASSPDGTEKPSSTIFLKIGRASNVQQRMNQWSRQCKHKVTVLRYYPVQSISSLSSSSPFQTPQASPNLKGATSTASPPLKVPHAHKVERLIQLELRNSQVQVNCEGCGKVHREWFEVEGSRAGVGRVDAVIKRWVNWSLGASAAIN